MRDKRPETIDDIVADIRAQNQGLPEDSYALSPLVCDLLGLADRIEAAYNFKLEAVCENSSHVGNAAAMREALEAVVKVGYPHNFQKEAPHIRAYCYEITTAIKKCFAALSSPPRNCDVGTAEEQFKRFNKFCFPIKCRECKLYTEEELYDCIFRWAQMPYEKGGAE